MTIPLSKSLRPLINIRIKDSLIVDDPWKDIIIEEQEYKEEKFKDGYLEIEDYEKLKNMEGDYLELIQ